MASRSHRPTPRRSQPRTRPRARLQHATERVRGGAAVVIRQAVDLTLDRPSPVVGLIGMAAVTGSGLANPAAAYPPIVPADTAAMAFSAACGARRSTSSRSRRPGCRSSATSSTTARAASLAFQRAAVYRELGLRPPTLEAVREASATTASGPPRRQRPGARGREPRCAGRGRPRPDRPGGRRGLRRFRRRAPDARGAGARLPRAGLLPGGGGARAQHEPDRLLPAAPCRRRASGGAARGTCSD